MSFSLLTLKVIIDIYELLSILNLVFQLILYFFFISSSFYFSFCGFDDTNLY